MRLMITMSYICKIYIIDIAKSPVATRITYQPSWSSTPSVVTISKRYDCHECYDEGVGGTFDKKQGRILGKM